MKPNTTFQQYPKFTIISLGVSIYVDVTINRGGDYHYFEGGAVLEKLL
jgi:hypothetical protein